MKKSIIATVFLAGLLLFFAPPRANASVWGLSGVGYDSNTREIFGLSATWLDYDLAWYYDPEVLGELYWQFNDEVPLDSGYGVGLSLPQYGILIPAGVNLYSTSYLPVTLYTTYSTHFVRSYYFYSSCSGFFSGCYADPFGFSNYFGGLFGSNGGWPGFGFNPFFFTSGRRYTLGTTHVSILTPPGPFCLPSLKAGESMVSADGATAPPCPTPTPTPTPTPVVVLLDVLPPVLRPVGVSGGNNTAEVRVTTTPATANRTVTLTLEGVANSGGHIDAAHTGRRPVGQLRRRTGTTNASGEFRTTYSPSHISGTVTVRASVAGGHNTPEQGVQTRVLDLQELQAGTNYELIGFANTPAHPQGTNHWGTPQANAGLVQIADDYKNFYYGQNAIPQNDKLHYNDQSLPWGGKFELAARWGAAGSHAEHRVGINCDVRCCANPGNVPQARWQQLNAIFFQRGSTDTFDETTSAQPHWHLRFLFGAQAALPQRNAGGFISESFSAALEREADPDEWQDLMATLEAAQAQGQTQTLDAAKATTAALFHSVEYANRNRTDQEFVTDLYATFLLREPDGPGYNFWLTILANDNASGINGRAHLIQAFVECEEFRNLIFALTDTPPPGPVCSLIEEQSCYNQGGIWDPGSCFCIVEPDPDPCIQLPHLCDQYPIGY